MNVHYKGVRMFYIRLPCIREPNDPNNHNIIVRAKKKNKFTFCTCIYSYLYGARKRGFSGGAYTTPIFFQQQSFR